MNDEREMSTGIFANNNLEVGATRQEQIDAGVSYLDSTHSAANKVTQYRLQSAPPPTSGGVDGSVLVLIAQVIIMLAAAMMLAYGFSVFGLLGMLGLAASGVVTIPIMLVIALRRWPVVRQHLKKIGIIFFAGYVLSMAFGFLATLAAHLYLIRVLLKCTPVQRK